MLGSLVSLERGGKAMQAALAAVSLPVMRVVYIGHYLSRADFSCRVVEIGSGPHRRQFQQMRKLFSKVSRRATP